MSGFDVRTDALRRAASRLEELSDDVAAAATYGRDHLLISGGDDGALFNHVNGVAADVRERLATLFTTLDTLTRDSGTELRGAARWYDDSDLAAVRAADAQLAVLEQAGDSFGDLPSTPDTTPSDPGDYVPSEHGAAEPPPQPDDGEMLMAPGP